MEFIELLVYAVIGAGLSAAGATANYEKKGGK